jgi:replicative DNA helicase
MTPQNPNFTDKPMPSSPEAEETILGSVLLDNDLMQQCAESLEVQDFYSPTNRRIFEGMLSLFTDQKPIDAPLVGEEIRRKGNEIPSASITNLAMGLPPQLNIAEYIDAVRDTSNRRQLIRTCNAIAGNAYEGEDVFNDAQAQINDLCLRAETGTDEYFVPVHKVIDSEVFRHFKT